MEWVKGIFPTYLKISQEAFSCLYLVSLRRVLWEIICVGTCKVKERRIGAVLRNEANCVTWLTHIKLFCEFLKHCKCIYIIEHRMLEWLTNLSGRCLAEILFRHLYEGLGKVADVFEIRTERLPNTSLQRYLYTSLYFENSVTCIICDRVYMTRGEEKLPPVILIALAIWMQAVRSGNPPNKRCLSRGFWAFRLSFLAATGNP